MKEKVRCIQNDRQKKVSKRMNEKGIFCQDSPSVIRKASAAGITLVALVVTIVVLIILAGITITYVMGDNSVFNRASEAKLKTDIAQWQERLEMAKSPIFIEGLGTFYPDKYFDYIQQQGIINNKDTDVIDNEDGTYDITTKPGYVFLITLMPIPENPTDAEIEYVGQAGKMAPIIKKLDVSATSNSITGKAVVARLGNGTIKYYYKSTSAADSTYQEITNINAEMGATQSSGITAGESYTIKVVAKNGVGEVELTKEITATKIFVESITLNKTAETIKVGSTLTLEATIKPDNSTNPNVTWESSKPGVATVDENGNITAKTKGETTITVSTTDGSNKLANCMLTVELRTVTASDLANVADKSSIYGKTVTGYSCTNSTAVANWKIFYAGSDFSTDEKNRIYLIADDYIARDKIPLSSAGHKLNDGDSSSPKAAFFTNILNDYTGSANIADTRLKKLNNDYFNTKSYSSSKWNMKIVAYMMDTSVWDVYRDTNKAEYAIGGPTIEVLFKSYSQKYEVDYRARAENEWGYRISKDGTNWADSYDKMLDTSDTLYVLPSTNGANAMWLSSPSFHGTTCDFMLGVRCGGAVACESRVYSDLGFRPLICLNSNLELEQLQDGNFKIK